MKRDDLPDNKPNDEPIPEQEDESVMQSEVEDTTLDPTTEQQITERVLEEVQTQRVDEEMIRQVTQQELKNIFQAMLESSELYGTVGPSPGGEFHTNPGWGPHFMLSDSLRIEGATVDAETAGEFTTEIWKFDRETGRQGTEPIYTKRHSVDKGLNRIDLGFDLQPGGYQIARSENFPLRRIRNWDGWKNTAHPRITLVGAGSQADDYKRWSDYYHYYFDVTVAPADQSLGEKAIRQATRDISERYAQQLRQFIERGNRALDHL